MRQVRREAEIFPKLKNKYFNIIFMHIYDVSASYFDICSNLYIEDILKIGISTYIKPIFIFIFLRMSEK